MSDSGKPITSRHVGGLRVLQIIAFVFCALAALLTVFDPPKSNAIWQTYFLFGVPGIFALAVTPYLLFNRIIADENGLRWRGASPIWKSARWDEITDFSIDSAMPKYVHQTIETRNGNIHFGEDDSFHQELAALVAASAIQTPYREWGVKGLRPNEKFEIVFVTRELSWLALLSAFVPLMLLALVLMRWVWKAPWLQWQEARALNGDWVAALAYLMPPLLLAFFVCGMVSIILTPWASSLILRERVYGDTKRFAFRAARANIIYRVGRTARGSFAPRARPLRERARRVANALDLGFAPVHRALRAHRQFR